MLNVYPNIEGGEGTLVMQTISEQKADFVRRTGSRFGARLEPFGHVDIQLHEGRSLDTVTQVESLAAPT